MGPYDNRTPDDFRAALDELGLSQREFAAIIDTDYTAVNRWALGKAKIQGAAWAYLDLKLGVKRLAEQGRK